MHTPSRPGPGDSDTGWLPGAALFGLTVLLGALMLLAYAPSVSAQEATIRYVHHGASGDNEPGTSCTNAGYPTIAAAVEGAEDGDVIHVCEDAHAYEVDDLEINDLDITIRGDGTGDTIIEPDAAGEGTRMLRLEGSDVTIEDLTIQGANYDSSSGAAILLESAALTINDSEIIDNTSGNGAITGHEDSTITIHGSDMSRNESAGNGGAIVADNGTTVTITGSTISDNESEGHGGAIFVENGDLIIEDSVFEDNYADGGHGGAIHANSGDGPGALVIEASQFVNNETAYEYGGAIYFNGGAQVAITASEFTENEADYDGGALYVDSGSLAIVGSHFHLNKAGHHGGAIDFGGDEFVVVESVLQENVAGESGGAIDFAGDDLVIIDSILQENVAGGDGGAIDFAGDNLIIVSSMFQENEARDDGGAIDFAGDNLVVVDSVLQRNVAGGDGGAIYVDADGAVEIVGSLIEGNVADDEGDQLWLDANSATVTYSMVEGGENAVQVEDHLEAPYVWWGNADGAPSGTFSGSGTPVEIETWLATLDLDGDEDGRTATLRDNDGEAVTDSNAGLEIRFTIGSEESDVALDDDGSASHTPTVSGTATAELLIAGTETGLVSGAIGIDPEDDAPGPPPPPTLPAPTPEPDAEPDATLTPEPEDDGITLSVWGGGDVDDLPEAISYWVIVDGEFIGYIPGASDFVNADFLDHFEDGFIPAGTVLIVVR